RRAVLATVADEDVRHVERWRLGVFPEADHQIPVCRVALDSDLDLSDRSGGVRPQPEATLGQLELEVPVGAGEQRDLGHGDRRGDDRHACSRHRHAVSVHHAAAPASRAHVAGQPPSSLTQALMRSSTSGMMRGAELASMLNAAGVPEAPYAWMPTTRGGGAADSCIHTGAPPCPPEV